MTTSMSLGDASCLLGPGLTSMALGDAGHIPGPGVLKPLGVLIAIFLNSWSGLGLPF